MMSDGRQVHLADSGAGSRYGSVLVAPEARVTLIEAPAGFGKSALLRTWSEVLARADVPARLLEAGRSHGSQAAQAADQLTSGLTGPSSAAVLMIDGWELLSAADASRIEGVILAADRRLRWMIASRTCTNLQLTPLRLEGEVRTLRAEQLASATPEHGAPAEVEWPALAQLTSASSEEPGILSPEARAYIDGEVLSVLSAEEIDVLTGLSLMDPITVPIASQLSNRNDLSSMLFGIAERTFLLTRSQTPSDIASFRIRPPLRRHLIFALERRDGEEARLLRLRLAELLTSEGDLSGACTCFLEAREWRSAALLFERLGVTYSLEHGVEHHHHLLEALPVSVREDFPRVQLAWIYTMIRTGHIEEARRLYRRLSNTTHNFWVDRDGGDVARLQIDAKFVEFTLAAWSGSVLSTRQLNGHELFFETAPVTTTELAFAYMFLTYSCLQRGNLRSAEEALHLWRQVSGVSAVSGPTFWRHYYGAVIARERCQTRASELHMAAASNELGSGHPTQERNHGLWLTAAEAELNYELNALGGLSGTLEALIRRADDNEMLFGLLAGVYLTLASCAFVDHGVQKALEVLRSAEDLGARLHQPAFNVIASAHRIRLLLRAGWDKAALVHADEAGLADRLRSYWMGHECTWNELLETSLAAAACEIVKGEGARAHALLTPSLQRAEEAGCVLSVAKMSLLAAAAADQMGETGQAGLHLRTALGALLPQGLDRPLIDEARLLEPLLAEICRAPGRYGLGVDEIEQTRQALGLLKSTGARPWLSAKEIAIIRHLSGGETNKSIGRLLHVTESTIKYHLKNIYAKLGVTTRQEAVSAAYSRRLLT